MTSIVKEVNIVHLFQPINTQLKMNMIIDKRSLFINTKEEVNSGNTNYDKKLFITISLEVVE